MKKLVLIFGVFVLIVMPVFGQFSIGGIVETHGLLAQGDLSSMEGVDDITTRGGWGFEFNVTLANLAETAGATAALVDGTRIWAYGWWRPNRTLFLKSGDIFRNSTWAEGDITCWGFHANYLHMTRPLEGFAGNVLRSGHGFFLPTMVMGRDPAMQITLTPINALTLNIGFPLQIGSPFLTDRRRNTFTETYWGHLHAQLVYEFAGIGEVAFSFVNAPACNYAENAAKRLFVHWKMPLGEDMRIELGVNYDLPGQNLPGTAHPNRPLNIGLGWGMGNLENDDQMVINARFGAAIPMIDTDSTRLGLEVLFSYDLGIFRLYVPAGLGLLLPANGDPLVAWSFAPYIARSLFGPYLFIGFNIFNGDRSRPEIGDREIVSPGNVSNLNWSIPIGMRWEFSRR